MMISGILSAFIFALASGVFVWNLP